ncbi:hypothetical protein IV417_14120 [Alphaproteobacteria bacterium KMM 3653]|uniref:Uncharacterized protein n=1 Tax=Harenicola maris TaxID=2841044 RepID=A0AAP2CQ75_9RHOB|nr:hypothetical protein [Harenicola maris]
MRYPSLTDYIAATRAKPIKGPVAMIFIEDPVEIDTTFEHHQTLGFATTIAFAPKALEFDLPDDPTVVRVDHDLHADSALETAVNAVIGAAPAGTWMYYCYNAEYLFFPFNETRNIGEMLAFHTEERRDAMLTYVIDLYADNLDEHPNAVSIENAHLDKSGYYALARLDPANHNHPKERQLNFYGGLRWRFEEHIPEPRRKIDRISIFRSKPGLTLLPGHVFSDEEYNTYACPWHHNLTASVCSFRTAKALKSNPGSRYDIDTFHWYNSVRFEWDSQQLLTLGLMEPGQWY